MGVGIPEEDPALSKHQNKLGFSCVDQQKYVHLYVLIIIDMKVITTREIVRETKAYFELAEKERVAVKRGKKYVNLIVTDNPDDKFVNEDWINEFMNIPEEYRVNPFDRSPSGDLFFADRRNIDHIDKARTGQTKRLSEEEKKKLFSL
ncbi:MAG: hypothetical protein RBQ63_03725 [Acholeplasmatales bacterium]|nr:hypothetical protein [Acholeplasmatales bacterium]